jgi:competence protein CoiA
MLYAKLNDDKILATPHAMGKCSFCGEQLRPKCGEIVAWHWAHINDTGCCEGHEPETAWHLQWKKRFADTIGKDYVEVDIGDHRADVRTPSDIVIEFQHSGISVAQIQEREREYGNMVWVLDAQAATLDGRITWMRSKRSDYLEVNVTRWRATLKDFTRPVFLDIEAAYDVLHIRDFSQRKLTKN